MRLWPMNWGGSAFIKKSGEIQKNAYSNITPAHIHLPKAHFIPSFLLSFIFYFTLGPKTNWPDLKIISFSKCLI
jgi:hypothetical protein